MAYETYYFIVMSAVPRTVWSYGDLLMVEKSPLSHTHRLMCSLAVMAYEYVDEAYHMHGQHCKTALSIASRCEKY